MRKIATLFVALFAVALMAPRAQAQFVLMPHVGYDLDVESLFIGIGVEVPLQFGDLPFALAARPSIEYYFGDSDSETVMGETFGASMSIVQINGDVVAQFIPPEDGIGVYGGAGLGISIMTVSVDAGPFSGSDSETELGLNLFGGAQFGAGGIAPFAEFRMTTPFTTRLQLKGGVRIAL